MLTSDGDGDGKTGESSADYEGVVEFIERALWRGVGWFIQVFKLDAVGDGRRGQLENACGSSIIRSTYSEEVKQVSPVLLPRVVGNSFVTISGRTS
jgi:hypothetical protein